MRWKSYRTILLCALGMLGALPMGQLARGDEGPPQDFKRLYNETLVKLKSAQDRKAELASQVAQLQERLASQTAQVEQFKRQTASFAEKTYFLRCHFAAWTQFMDDNPLTKMQWDLYLDRLTPLSPALQATFIDSDWPLSDRP